MSIQLKARVHRGEFCLDVDMKIPAEGVTALFGRSGCGKTSLLRILAGLDKVPSAAVLFNGQRWQQDGVFVPLHKRRLGLVFQESSLLPHLSVQGNLLYGYQRTAPALRRMSLQQVSEMLEMKHLLTRPIDKLSGGERQRVALGRALLTNPQLLLLDEPLAALDSQSKAEIMPFLARLASEAKIPMLLVSHSAIDVEKLADRIVFMQQGKISSIETLAQATFKADSPLFYDSGPAVILQGKIGAPDSFHRYAFGNEQVQFWLAQAPRSSQQHGTQRLRVAARDVSLAIGPTGQLSIQNQIPVQVSAITGYQQQLMVSLRLADGQQLLAEITHHAANTLGLKPGMQVTALVKGVALVM